MPLEEEIEACNRELGRSPMFDKAHDKRVRVTSHRKVEAVVDLVRWFDGSAISMQHYCRAVKVQGISLRRRPLETRDVER